MKYESYFNTIFYSAFAEVKVQFLQGGQSNRVGVMKKYTWIVYGGVCDGLKTPKKQVGIVLYTNTLTSHSGKKNIHF